MMRRCVLVLSGFNIRAVVAFCRWASASDVEYRIIARGQEDPIFQTSFRNRVVFSRRRDYLTIELFQEWIDRLRREFLYEEFLVLPSSEFLNRFLLANRSVLEGFSCVIPLPDERLYSMISDKESFVSLCRSYGIDSPPVFHRCPDTPPFVAKPRRYSTGNERPAATRIILDQFDLTTFLKEKHVDYFFQEFIPGRSFYLLAFIGREQDVLFSQENLIQQARGASIILARRTDFHERGIASDFVAMFRDLGFVGLVMVEVRHDETSNRYFMIEANPRLWGPMQFVVDNNVDLFGALLREFGWDVPNRPVFPWNEYYFWSGGLSADAQPFAFHSFSEKDFVRQYHSIQRCDLFLREDTLNLYCEEAHMVWRTPGV